ncbi:ribosomal protein L1 [Ceraceosorus guamensis]|uniref:Ribosomal protein L1 n=1 Tax=Ceraceosorus guamensis TaxID=1522189 RepID=A0A316W8C8_9BASI|nr:ribosomal protein L1 [Ceraceosorus guamensis]PWN45368.1 ribosomal protein L1 [Ceraceosorus guamensis]
MAGTKAASKGSSGRPSKALPASNLKTAPSAPLTSSLPEKSSDPDKLLGRVSRSQCLKAMQALEKQNLKWKSSSASGGKSQLPLEGGSAADEVLFLQVNVKRLSPTRKVKPYRIPLPHSPHAPTSEVLLLVKDPQRATKDLLIANKIKSIHRVVDVSKLKGKFSPYEARRQLMNSYDIFLADERILRMLPKLLGKKWLESKKQPHPVDITRPENGRLDKELNAVLNSTQYAANKGCCVSVRLGTLSHLSAEQLVDQFSAALPKIVSRVEGGWENLKSLEVKTAKSVSLPVWNCDLKDLWVGAKEVPVDEETAEASDEDDDDEEEDEEEEEEDHEDSGDDDAEEGEEEAVAAPVKAAKRAAAVPTKASAASKDAVGAKTAKRKEEADSSKKEQSKKRRSS